MFISAVMCSPAHVHKSSVWEMKIKQIDYKVAHMWAPVMMGLVMIA